VAVASAEPYANHLHLAPDKQPCQYLTTQFFYRPNAFLPPNQQCQSIEGNGSVKKLMLLCYVVAKLFVEQGRLRRRVCSPLMINRLCCIGFGSCSFVARSFTSPAVMARACRYRQWSNDYSVTVVTVSVAAVVIITSHRASTSTRWHFVFALCCHGNETRAPIANPPNSAQLGGTPTIPQVTSRSVQ